MRLSLLRHLRSSRSWNVGSAVTRDADRLIAQWGSEAYAHATEMSWREDSGLVQSPHQGHWWSVRREIGRRFGRPDQDHLTESVA